MNKPQSYFASLVVGVAMLAPMAASASTSVEVSARSNGERIQLDVATDMLATDEGAAQVYASMKKRAMAACKREIPRKTGKKLRVKSCTRKLVNGFVKDLDDGRVSALHDKKG